MHDLVYGFCRARWVTGWDTENDPHLAGGPRHRFAHHGQAPAGDGGRVNRRGAAPQKGASTAFAAAPSPAAPLSPTRAPRRSPIPSRLTRIPGARPLIGLPSGREAGELPLASARAGAAARIGELCSAPATPVAAGASGAQRRTAGTTHSVRPSAPSSPPPLPATASQPPIPTQSFRARAPKAAGLSQVALAVLPGARGLRPLDAFPGGQGIKHSAAGPKSYPGLASPTRELAGSDPVQPAFVVLSLRRRRPAPDRFPWRKAPTVRQCERPNELWGTSQSPARVARICFTPSPHTRELFRPAIARFPWQAASTERQAGGPENAGYSSHRPRAARSCSALSVFSAHPATADLVRTLTTPANRGSGATHPSRAAVTRRARSEAELKASALTAVPAHNRARSAGRAARAYPSDPHTLTGTAPPADLLASAVSAPSRGTSPGTTTHLSSLTTASTTQFSHQSQPKNQIRLAGSDPEIHLDRRDGTQPTVTPACVGRRPSALNSQEER